MNKWFLVEDKLPDLNISNGMFKYSRIVLCAIQYNDGAVGENIGWYNEDGTWSCESERGKVVAWAEYTYFFDHYKDIKNYI